jgi:tetratricopeptide (TPR) repeat protein
MLNKKRTAAIIALLLLSSFLFYASLTYAPFLVGEGFFLTKFTGYRVPAIKILSKALEKEPNNARAFFLRGTAYSLTGQYEKAIQDLDRALELVPDNPLAHKMRGDILGITGDHVKAVKDLSLSIAGNPRDPSASVSRAFSYAKENKDDDALADYGKALELGSSDKAIYLGRGRIFLGRGEYESAEREYSAGLAKHPYSFELFGQRAIARVELGRYDDARSDLERTLRLNPDRKADFHYSMGNILQREGKYRAAAAEYSLAISENPSMAEAYDARGTAYDSVELYDSALADYEKALTLSPDAPVFYLDRGVTYIKQKETDKAIKDLEKAVAIDPEFALAHIAYMKLAYLYNESGLKEKALEYCDRAIVLYPDYLAAYQYRAGISLALGYLDLAIADYDLLLKKKPASPEVYALRGWAYFKKGDNANSVADSGNAIALDPDKAAPYYNRGLALYMDGEYQNALRDYIKATDLDPDPSSALSVFRENVPSPNPDDTGNVRGEIVELLRKGLRKKE